MRIYEFMPEGINECKVTAWIQTEPGAKTASVAHAAVIICPGGGYNFISQREAEPVAKPFFDAGYCTFILEYSVKEKAKGFQPLSQLAATITHIRKYAEEFGVAPNRVAVCGFSAGGHLAASLGILHNKERFLDCYGRTEHIRPDAMLLCYPVITADAYAHIGSIQRISGADTGSAEYEWFGLDQHVDAQTPPAFIWHTVTDPVVPVENSLKLCMAMSKCNIPYEFHIFPNGPHGMSVCTEEVGAFDAYNARWVEWSIKWLNNQLNV